MPRYEFWCDTCGGFEQQMRMADAVSMMPCPECGQESHRVYSPVGLMTLSPATRRKLEAVGEPKVMRRDELKGTPIHAGVHGHSAGHGHAHGGSAHHHATMHGGLHSQIPTRPWQAGH